MHNDSRSGEEGPERQSALQGAAFRHVSVQKIGTRGETGQQDDEQGGLQPESEAQDRKQFNIAAPDPVRKSETCEKQQGKNHKETDEGCRPIRTRQHGLAKHDTEKQYELEAVGNQQVEIVGNRYDQQQREHKSESNQLQHVCCVEIIEQTGHETGNDFRSEVQCIYFCGAVRTLPVVGHVRKNRKKIFSL